jgi:hypothetical protein
MFDRSKRRVPRLPGFGLPPQPDFAPCTLRMRGPVCDPGRSRLGDGRRRRPDVNGGVQLGELPVGGSPDFDPPTKQRQLIGGWLSFPGRRHVVVVIQRECCPVEEEAGSPKGSSSPVGSDPEARSSRL